MKATAAVLLAGHAAATDAPIGKVLTMLSGLEQKVIKDGEVTQKEYAEFAEWCEDQNRNLGFEIKTGKGQVEDLKAAIAEESATIDTLTSRVDELAGAVGETEATLKKATKIREKEAADFKEEEKDLAKMVSMLERAAAIIEREMQGGAAMLQIKHASDVVQAFKVMVQASLIETTDADKLAAFVQEQGSDEDSDEDGDSGAPAAAAYKNQSGGLVDVLNDLLDKASQQLDALRNKEVELANAFELLKQSLESETKNAADELKDSKKGIAIASEKKSTAEGDLGVTEKGLKEDIKAKSTLHHDCKTKAQQFEAETKSRGEELKALATAKKLIDEATSLTEVSFLQVKEFTSSSYNVARFVRELAHNQHSKALGLLATNIASVMHSDSRDPFGKVKSLISDMIKKLEDAAGADAEKKAYCDKELSETKERKEDKTDQIKGLSTKIEQMAAKSAKLKEQVATLEGELSKLAKSQGEMDKLRAEEKAIFDATSAELEQGIAGLQAALKALNDYYGKADKAHDASDGAANGIISLLEVCEADFSKNLAQISTDEERAVSEYKAVTNENQVEKADKSQSVKYKSKEAKGLDKASAELKGDRNGAKAEMDAVVDYLKRIEAECIAKPETYEVRKKRREAELAGLKQALQILEDDAALVQTSQRVKRQSHFMARA